MIGASVANVGACVAGAMSCQFGGQLQTAQATKHKGQQVLYPYHRRASGTPTRCKQVPPLVTWMSALNLLSKTSRGSEALLFQTDFGDRALRGFGNKWQAAATIHPWNYCRHTGSGVLKHRGARLRYAADFVVRQDCQQLTFKTLYLEISIHARWRPAKGTK